MIISAWVVIGPSMMTAWNLRRDADPPESYSGPMDDTTYAILNSAADVDTVQAMYKTKTVQGQSPFTLYNMNFLTAQDAVDAIDWLTVTWPGNQFETQGVWDNTGLQLGVTYTFDIDGNITGTTGTPDYTIPTDAFTIMPDLDGVPATSNADLRDINLLLGELPRSFV